MTPSNRAKLEEIFKVVLDLPANENVEEIRQLNFSKWDSLAHVSLVSAIESEFSLSLEMEDVLALTSYQAADLLLSEKGL